MQLERADTKGFSAGRALAAHSSEKGYGSHSKLKSIRYPHGKAFPKQTTDVRVCMRQVWGFQTFSREGKSSATPGKLLNGIKMIPSCKYPRKIKVYKHRNKKILAKKELYLLSSVSVNTVIYL